MEKKFIPAISIIIPVYNAEKYLPQCLESIFKQTFQDFELILVDDCSSDSSREIIEKYSKNFFDKLKLIKLNSNSGHPGIPTNIGIKISRGEYLFIIDDDDALTKDALEGLYYLAKNFDADVVQCQKFLQINAEDNYQTLEKILKIEYQKAMNVTEPTFLSENFGDRVNFLRQRVFLWNLWSKLIKRDFFAENNIELINAAGQDMVCTCCLMCSAKKYLIVPNVTVYYRLSEDSASHKPLSDNQTIHTWLTAMKKGFLYLDKFLERQKFFQENSLAKYLVLEVLFNDFNSYIKELYGKSSGGHELDKIFREEFSEVPSNLAAFTFNLLNLYQIKIEK